jgi:Mg-chelatase subunit ChlD
MDAQLRKWQTGYETIVGKTGARLSIPDYIRHQDEPFATRLKRSVMGKKLLIVADFSGSMGSRQEDYKKALISAIEVLNKVGSNIALFGFGGDPAQGEVYFRVKTFEEPKWTVRHSSKVAALEADFGSTPLGSAYRHLGTYIARHKPDITVTMTDGQPDNVSDAMQQISKLKKHTRMVAFGMAEDPEGAQDMAKNLKTLGYHKSVAVSDLRTLPPQLVKLMVPT